MGKRAFWIRLAATAASGLMLAALIPPLDLSFLVWIAFAPLLAALWSLEGKRAAWKGFGLGFLAAVICHAIQLSWLTVVSPLGAIVLPLYLALFSGLAAAFSAKLGHPARAGSSLAAIVRTAFANAAVFAGLEWLRGWLFTGFGWNNIGIAFHENLPVSQAADLLGVGGLTFLVIFVQGLAILAFKFRKKIALAPIAASLLLVYGYGAYRISSQAALATTPLKALLLQVNIPQDAAQVAWDQMRVHSAYENDTLAALTEAKAKNEFPDWVIWPESALTGRIMRTDDGAWGVWEENVRSIETIRQAGDFSLIYGVNELEAVAEGDALVQKPDGRSYNSLAALTPANELQTFRKHHLVIFGETIPFVESIPLLKKIYEQQAGVEYHGSFSAGDSFEPLSLEVGGRKIGIIPSICFEDTVPRLARRFLKSGPQVIVNVTNDGWFKESPAADQHFANARFRAIELRRPMLRCANTGVSAAISSSGQVLQTITDAEGSHFTRGSMLAKLEIPLNPSTSLYALIGDFGIIFTGILGFACPMLFRRRA